MRITTQLLYQNALARLSEQQNALLRTQQEVATGRRIVSPSDDPVAASQVVGLEAALARTEQLASNRRDAVNALGLTEGTLARVGDLVQDLQSAVVAAGNAAWTDTERRFLATELRGRLQELLGLANTVDADGQAIFGGFAGAQAAFAVDNGAVRFQGDGNVRELQVAEARRMGAGVSGQGVFEAVRAGNGRFLASADAANSGTLVVNNSDLVDATAWTGNRYQVQFSVSGGVTTYDVFDLTAGAPVSSGVPWQEGDAITVAGMQFGSRGAPANGDAVTLEPSPNRSVFSSLEAFIAALETPIASDADKARFGNALTQASDSFGNALETVLTARATVGGRLSELDALGAAGEDRAIQYQQALSELRDTDYNEAISRLTRQQLGLEAAQQTFSRIAGMSLFDYL